MVALFTGSGNAVNAAMRGVQQGVQLKQDEHPLKRLQPKALSHFFAFGVVKGGLLSHIAYKFIFYMYYPHIYSNFLNYY